MYSSSNTFSGSSTGQYSPGSLHGSQYGSGRYSGPGGGVNSRGSIISGVQGEGQQGGEAAAAFYEAQQTALLLSRAGKGGGSMKKHRGERGMFGTASRSNIAGTMQ
jgi:hypothetical protein